MRNKSLWTKLVAFVLVAALVIPMSMGFAESVDAAGENLIANGDFDDANGEMDVTGWTPGAATAEKEMIDILGTGTFSSSKVFNIIGTGGTANRDTSTTNPFLKVTTEQDTQVMIQTTSTVTTGETYVVSYQIKIPTEATGVEVQPSIYWANAKTNDYGTIHADTEGEWIFGSFTCTVPANDTLMRLRFTTKGYTGEAFYLDNVMVSYATDKTELVNHVENSDFSATELNWSVEESNTGTVTSGSGTMAITRTNYNCTAVYNEQIPVIPGTTYAISYDMLGDGNNTRVFPRILEISEDGAEKDYNSYTGIEPRAPGASWQSVPKSGTTATYTASANAAYVVLKIYVNNVNGTVQIDNVGFKSTETVYSDGIIKNGSGYEMKLSNGNTATYEDVTLEANKYYDYSYAVTNSGLARAGLKMGEEIQTAASGSFQYTEGMTIGFATEGTGTAYFDELVISEHANHVDEDDNSFCDYCNKFSCPSVVFENPTFTTTGSGDTTTIDGWEIIKTEYFSDNLMTIGDFETSTTEKWSSQNANDTFEIESESPTNKVLKLTRATTGASGGLIYYNSNVTLKPNTVYEFSYRMKGADSGTANDYLNYRIYPFITLYDSENAKTDIIWNDDTTPIRQPQTDWQSPTFTFTTGEDTTATLPRIKVNTLQAFTGSGILYLDDITIREVNSNKITLTAGTQGGVIFEGGEGCYLQTTTTSRLATNSTYIMSLMGSAMSEGKVIVSSGAVSSDIVHEEEKEISKAYLIPTSVSEQYWIRIHAIAGNPLTLTDISMRLNVGDFNNNGTWESSEYDSMRASIVGNEVDETVLGDLDGDGESTALDIVRMQLYAVGLK